MLVSTPVLLRILARAYLDKENGGSQLKRASIVREKKYYELVEQLKDRTQDVTFSATKALSLLMLFSRYLVN